MSKIREAFEKQYEIPWEMAHPNRKEYFEAGYQAAIAAIREGWIDVKDRLPDTAGVFLVMCDRGIQSYHPIIGIFNRDFDSPYPWSVPGTASVTHWMPLPAAPSPQEVK